MSDLPELRKRLITGAVWSVLIADHHADTLTPRQIERLYDASNAMRKADAALQKLAELEAENASLRHWSVGHIDALLLYAAGSYPNDSHVKDAVEFCRIVAPDKRLRMDPLRGSGWHPAQTTLARPLPSPPKGDVA